MERCLIGVQGNSSSAPIGYPLRFLGLLDGIPLRTPGWYHTVMKFCWRHRWLWAPSHLGPTGYICKRCHRTKGVS